MQMAKLDIQAGDPAASLRAFMAGILGLEEIDAVLVPRRLPAGPMVMPALVSHPAGLDGMDPLAPAFALNAAKMLSRLTRRPLGRRLAAMLRPCEIRAFIELVKLNQGSLEEVILLGLDCLGAMNNRDYLSFAGDDPEAATRRFFQQVMAEEAPDDPCLAPACKVCEKPLADGADLAVLLYGLDNGQHLIIEAKSGKGASLLDRLHLAPAEPPTARASKVQTLIGKRIAARDRMFAATHAATGSLEKLSGYLAACVNCYNCRVACPVCYCRECVFLTDAFDHEPRQYLSWAGRQGALKMPTDTVFYHLTRLAHMSTACVGCGQCSNACPNDIPVMELVRSVAHHTQAAFDYQAGADVSDAPPLTVFKEEEFEEVVGL